MQRTNFLIYGSIFLTVVASAAAISQLNVERDATLAKAPVVTIQATANAYDAFVYEGAPKATAPSATLIQEIRDSVLRPNVGVSNANGVVPTDDVLTRISAHGVLVQRLNGSSALLAQAETSPWPLASLTKLMTAVVAADELGFDTVVPVSDIATLQEGAAGGLSAGETYTVSDLIAIMLLTSSNDAAFALEEAVTSAQFIDRMRAKTVEIGMIDTLFTDSTGLSFLNQGTARDMISLLRYISSHYPELLEMTKNKEMTVVELTRNVSRKITSIHPYAGKTDFFGGKTGYTDAAKGNLISLFSVNGETYFISVFGSNDRKADTEILYQWLITHLSTS